MKSNRRLTINLIANVISYSTTVIISFFLTPYLIKELGKEAYSFYPMANNFVQYMSIITVALNSMASRFITIEVTRGNLKKANIYFSSVFYSNIILSLFLIVPMILIVIFLDKMIHIPFELIGSIKILFSLVFLSMIINIMSSVFSIAVFAKNRIDLRSMGDIFQAILKLILYLVLFFMFTPSIIYVGLVAFFLSITYLIIHSIYTRKLLPELKISIGYFDIKSIKEILFSGVWNSVNQIGSSLMFSLAILYCNVFVGVSAAGEYSIVQTMPNLFNGIITMLSSVFYPIITQTYATSSKENLVKEIHNSQKIMGMITNIPIVIFIAVGFEFFSLWVPNENAMRLEILSFLTIVHLIIIGVAWPLSNLNTVINKVKIPAIYMVLCGLLNFIVVYLLTQYTSLGVYAIPLSSCPILIIWALFFIPIYPCLELKIKKSTFYPAIIKTLISGAFIFTFVFVLKKFIVVNSWFTLILLCFVAGIFGLICNFMIIFSKQEKQMLINRILKR